MRGWLFLVVVSAAACTRDPLDTPCPDVDVGGLVLTEIRGAQTGAPTDSGGQWVEIYNASGQTVELGGLELKLRKIDGSGEERVLVRSGDDTIAAGGYATLGRFAHGSEPAHITYGFISDVSTNLYPAAALELRACGVLIDRAIYRSLPATGSFGYDGAKTPDATGNDTESAWCADAAADKLGTPLARNRTCTP